MVFALFAYGLISWNFFQTQTFFSPYENCQAMNCDSGSCVSDIKGASFWVKYFGFRCAFSNKYSQPSIEVFSADLNHKISAENLAIVKKLFIQNSININDFQITYFSIDKTAADNPEVGYYVVKANRIYNNLAIFIGGEAIYHFNRSGAVVYQTGSVYLVDQDIPLIPQITQEEAVAILMNKYPSVFSRNKVFAELGISIATVGLGNTDNVVSWKISVGENTIPYAVVNAINGKIIYFESGIRVRE